MEERDEELLGAKEEEVLWRLDGWNEDGGDDDEGVGKCFWEEVDEGRVGREEAAAAEEAARCMN